MTIVFCLSKQMQDEHCKHPNRFYTLMRTTRDRYGDTVHHYHRMCGPCLAYGIYCFFRSHGTRPSLRIHGSEVLHLCMSLGQDTQRYVQWSHDPVYYAILDHLPSTYACSFYLHNSTQEHLNNVLHSIASLAPYP